MWDAILGVFTGGISSILAGGATGLLGILAQRFFDFKTKQLDLQSAQIKNAHEIAVIKANGELMAQEYAGKTQVAQVEAAGRSDVAASEAFAASLKVEPTRYADGVRPKGVWGNMGWFLMVLIDFIRGIVRPALTVYLCALTTLIYFQAQTIMTTYGMVIQADDAFKLVVRIIETILYLTTTCLLWWFGTRNSGPIPKAGRIQG